MSIPLRTDVVIIGAGPIGLITSLLLSQFGVHHLLVEQPSTPGEHPVAHFISVHPERGAMSRWACGLDLVTGSSGYTVLKISQRTDTN